MKKIIFIFLILMIPSVFANIVISSIPSEISSQIGKTTNYTWTVFNNYSFDIFDISVPELESKGFNFSKMYIKANSSNTSTFSVKTDESFFGTINAEVQFKFYLDLPEEIKTYPLLITDFGFNPTYLAIREGDTVEWANKGQNTYSIYSLEFGTIEIASNETKSYKFNSIKSVSYYETYYKIFNQFNGVIQVINRTEKQNGYNPNYDHPFSIILNSYSEPTNLTINTTERNYSVEHTSSKNGQLTIKNTGTNTAEKVSLTSDSEWISFNADNFSIKTGDAKYVEYTILPFLTNTSESNKTYQINISAKALNSEKQTITIEVFVPYKEILGIIESDFDFAVWTEKIWCPKHPCSSLCDPQLPECNLNCNGLNGANSTLTANITTIQLYETMNSCSALKSLVERSLNSQKTFFETFGITIEDAVKVGNESKILSMENQRRQKSIINTLSWLFFTLLAIGFIYFIWRIVSKKMHQKATLEDFSSNLE